MKRTIKSIKETSKPGNQIESENYVDLLLNKKSVIQVSYNLNRKLRRKILRNDNFQVSVNSMRYIDEVNPVLPTQPMPSIQPPVEPTEPPAPIPIQPPAPAPQIIPEPTEPSVPPIVPLPAVPLVPQVPFVPTAGYHIVAS